MAKISEEELEEYIYQKHNSISLANGESFPFSGQKILRQFKLPGYGVIDLLIIEIRKIEKTKFVVFKILELKKEGTSVDYLIQLCRYITGLRRLLEKKERKIKNKKGKEAKIYRIGDISISANKEPAIFGFLVTSNNNNSSGLYYLLDYLGNKKGFIDIIFYFLDLSSGISFMRTGKEWFSDGEKEVEIEKYIKEAIKNNNAKSKNYHT